MRMVSSGYTYENTLAAKKESFRKAFPGAKPGAIIQDDDGRYWIYDTKYIGDDWNGERDWYQLTRLGAFFEKRKRKIKD